MTSLTTEAETNNQAAAAAAAADALVQIATLDRHTSMDTIRELVHTVMASEEHASHLPILICHLRNHSKSLGQGNGGGGERLSTERLAVALYECDSDAGILLMRLFVVYGSWKSLKKILDHVDDLSISNGEFYFSFSQ